jgi:hypothetical protein
VGRVTQTRHYREDAILLHELPHHLHRVRGVEVIIAHHELDLAAVDTPLGVDVLEVRPYPIGDGHVGRRRVLAHSEMGAEQDLGVGDARHLLGAWRLGACRHGRHRRLRRLFLPAAAHQEETGEEHGW